MGGKLRGNDSYAALAGIDLSAAFDVVDVELLIKCLTILGLPEDVVALIKIWLKERFFYVCVNGLESTIAVIPVMARFDPEHI